MPLDEPRWWYGRTRDPRARLLAPLGHAYAWAVARRFLRARPVRAGLSVICVGNFTAGGTGKTPLAISLAEELSRAGAVPAFLTRGYGGRVAGPLFVDPELHTVRDVGDEPLLLARVAPTVVARDRRAGLALIESGCRPVDTLIMDDGLQNPAIAKDLTIAVVDGGRGFGNGQVIPAGPLRAKLDFQCPLADAIVVNGGMTSAGFDLLKNLEGVFRGPILRAEPRPAGDADWLRDAPVVAFAGIGNPRRFFALLESLGARPLATHVFPDHHPFTEGEARALLRAAERLSAQLVTTEKDLVRLLGSTGHRAELAARSRTLPIRLWMHDGDMERLRSLLRSLPRRPRPLASAPGLV